MNSLISLTTVRSIVTFCSLSYFAFLPMARAVLPPPDGGYPGGNTAEGVSALASLRYWDIQYGCWLPFA